MGISDHVEGEAFIDVVLGTNSIDCFLHLAVSAVASLHSVGSGGEQGVVEKGQGLFQVGRLEFAQDDADGFEPANPLTQTSQLGQRGVGAAASIKQAINLVHDLA